MWAQEGGGKGGLREESAEVRLRGNCLSVGGDGQSRWFRLLDFGQSQYEPLIACSQPVISTLRSVVKEGGLQAMWRGSSAVLIRLGLGAGFHFLFIDLAKSALQRPQHDGKMGLSPLAAALTGGTVGRIEETGQPGDEPSPSPLLVSSLTRLRFRAARNPSTTPEVLPLLSYMSPLFVPLLSIATAVDCITRQLPRLPQPPIPKRIQEPNPLRLPPLFALFACLETFGLPSLHLRFFPTSAMLTSALRLQPLQELFPQLRCRP